MVVLDTFRDNATGEDSGTFSYGQPHHITSFQFISNLVIARSLAEREPLACGVLVLRLAHTKFADVTQAMVQILENHVMSRIGYGPWAGCNLLCALLMLAIRKTEGKPRATIHHGVSNAIKESLDYGFVVRNPKPAAVLSLLSTIDPSDPIALLAQQRLTPALDDFAIQENEQRLAISLMGVAKILEHSKLEDVLSMLLRVSCEKDNLSIETASYILTAAHFSRYCCPNLSHVIINRFSPYLLNLYRPWFVGH